MGELYVTLLSKAVMICAAEDALLVSNMEHLGSSGSALETPLSPTPFDKDLDTSYHVLEPAIEVIKTLGRQLIVHRF